MNYEKDLLVIFLIFFNISSAYPNCELLNSSFDLSSKQEITKSDKAFIFYDGSLNMEGFVQKDEINISELIIII